MARHKDFNWDLIPLSENGLAKSETITLALLMDIRDKLQLISNVLQCVEVQRIPLYLKSIRTNTTRRKKR